MTNPIAATNQRTSICRALLYMKALVFGLVLLLLGGGTNFQFDGPSDPLESHELAFERAVFQGNLSEIDRLLRTPYIDVNAHIKSPRAQFPGQTFLAVAASRCQSANARIVAQRLLAAGADASIEPRPRSLYTLLYQVSSCSVEMVEDYLAAGLNPNALVSSKSNETRTVLGYIIQRLRTYAKVPESAIAIALLKAGANPNLPYAINGKPYGTSLINSIFAGGVAVPVINQMTDPLSPVPVDVNMRSPRGWTALDAVRSNLCPLSGTQKAQVEATLLARGAVASGRAYPARCSDFLV